MIDVWRTFAELQTGFYTAAHPERARRGRGWFAAISGVEHGELNICGLDPEATVAGAGELVQALGDLPAVVFTSEAVGDPVREVLLHEGFELAPIREPLMRAAAPPSPVAGQFRIAAATGPDVDAAIAVTAEAHHIAPELLAQTIAVAHRGGAPVWLAWDGDEPVSVAWLCRHGSTLGVAEMMTPARHQRRGAGRQLLSTALAELWATDTTGAVLLSTPAGRPLYESLGFVAVDEVISCFRGQDDEVIAAIGQPTER